MLPTLSNVELRSSTRLKRFCGFMAVYLMVLGWASAFSLRSWFMTLIKIAFPFLPESVQEDNHD